MRYISFDNIPENREWAFESVRSTEQWTHGYHRYPAKFLPDVVRKLIEDYAKDSQLIADLFAGCGTTLVEAKVHGISSVGTDINPVAQLITKVKTTALPPVALQQAYDALVKLFEEYSEKDYSDIKKHDRIDYWFTMSQKAKIAFLYDRVLSLDVDDNIKNFFYVCISHILKNCSWWLQSGTKPQRDLEKELEDPFDEFCRHGKKMMGWNEKFYDELSQKGYLDTPCEIHLEDARHTSILSGSINAIITSPPYVTSYEYADIHQLTAYWMEYISDIHEFRKKFIGSSYSGNMSLTVANSRQAQKIVNTLSEKSMHIARDVAQYFNDMQEVAKEMYRVLAPNGHACVVIGNTKIKEVQIKSAEVFFEFLRNAGLRKVKVIKRSIPHKLMPTLRDKNTGRFTKMDNPNCKKVYPNEYVIIMQKVS
jgi:DNA modification methylase